MDVFKALRALYEERQKLDEVIQALEDLQKEAEHPGNVALLRPERRGRRFMDEAARRQVSERMRSYWAKRKQQEPASSRSK